MKTKNGQRFSSKVGKRYGHLTVLKVDNNKTDKLSLICKCDCGKIISVNASNLSEKGGQRSCGCTRGTAKRKDITGIKFGELVAIEPIKDKNKKDVVWNCLCSCGNYTTVQANNLISGHTQSCGCKKEKQLKDTRARIEGLQKSLKTGRFETNIHAKMWTLVSPNGITYYIKNLTNFIRENHHLFGIKNNEVEITKQMKSMSYAAHHNHKCCGWIILCENK